MKNQPIKTFNAMLNSKDFITALEIISKHHPTELAINTPSHNFVGYIGQSKFRLHLKKCVPAVINSLIKEGFILKMGPEGLEVIKI
jgi:hypothetical protein